MMSLNGANKRIDEIKTRLLPPKIEIETDGVTVTIRWGGKPQKRIRADLWRGL